MRIRNANWFAVCARRLALAAALAFVAQGVGVAHAAAGAVAVASEGVAIWHVHQHDDGSKHVHIHPLEHGDGGHHDHDGKLTCCVAHAASMLPTPLAPYLAVPESAGPVYAAFAARHPSGLDPGGLPKPPRIPDIA
jgi:hypothetical protein